METKQILITGGTGFIGTYLCNELLKAGHYLTLVTRSPEKYSEDQAKNMRYIGWDDELAQAVNRTDVIINLAGESLFGQRWTDSVKKRIYDSRILTTQKLTKLIAESASKPDLFISASAVGIYGDSGDKILDESAKSGKDFLAKVCIDWEKEALKASDYGVRVAIPRIGIVLEDNGGVIDKMKLPFMFFVGGPIGSGNQFVPWVHMRDLCQAILYPIENEELEGPYNACSPNPVTMKSLANVIGTVMNRPAYFRVPTAILKFILGEAAEPILSSLRAHPKILQCLGFQFEFEDLEEALADIF
ncbi:MAG: TIGR01777 family oxidoreductase [Balneolaceae bacterium]